MAEQRVGIRLIDEQLVAPFQGLLPGAAFRLLSTDFALPRVAFGVRG
jgi:hypothetical protein